MTLDRRVRRYPQSLVEEHPGVWSAVNSHPRPRRLAVVRFLLVMPRGVDPRGSQVTAAQVGKPPERCLFGEGCTFPLPAALFEPGVRERDLEPPHIVWEPGESLLVLTSGPVDAMAVLCTPIDPEKEARP